ncbi:MAG: hypothetical protein FJ104_03525 [Deltaproteobacteria bacterium]|nr:hypothetical protein [Deltaproteobacteria bacterium]
MSQNPSSRPTALLLAALAGALALGLAAPAQAGDDACTTTKFSFPAVEKACKDGGRKGAKDLMKAVVKKAKDAGKDVGCKDCHADVGKTFELKANAVKDLKGLL